MPLGYNLDREPQQSLSAVFPRHNSMQRLGSVRGAQCACNCTHSAIGGEKEVEITAEDLKDSVEGERYAQTCQAADSLTPSARSKAQILLNINATESLCCSHLAEPRSLDVVCTSR